MRLKNWVFAGAVAAVVALVAAVDARSRPGGTVPYQTNRPVYLTNAPAIGGARVANIPTHGPAFGCVPSPGGNQAVLNPGSAGPALTGNSNNCSRAAAPGTGVSGPH